MQQIVDFLLSSNGLAFGVALLIFIITLFLVVKRLIGFLITLLLLAFAIVSGFFVANQDLLRNILKNYTGQATPEEQDTLNQLKAQFYKGYEELKTEVQEQKEAFKKILDKNKQEDQKK